MFTVLTQQTIKPIRLGSFGLFVRIRTSIGAQNELTNKKTSLERAKKRTALSAELLEGLNTFCVLCMPVEQHRKTRLVRVLRPVTCGRSLNNYMLEAPLAQEVDSG